MGALRRGPAAPAAGLTGTGGCALRRIAGTGPLIGAGDLRRIAGTGPLIGAGDLRRIAGTGSPPRSRTCGRRAMSLA
jgi:hypothetical protein